MARQMCPSSALIAALALGSAALAAPLAGQSRVTVSEYAARRTALAAAIDSGVIVAYGGVEPVHYWPNFFQLPAFYYLTGIGHDVERQATRDE